jgi:hypothetical protein
MAQLGARLYREVHQMQPTLLSIPHRGSLNRRCGSRSVTRPSLLAGATARSATPRSSGVALIAQPEPERSATQRLANFGDRAGNITSGCPSEGIACPPTILFRVTITTEP